MPTHDELDAMASLLGYGSFSASLKIEMKAAIISAVMDMKRNDILSDLVTTLDRIQNDVSSIAATLWDK